MARQTLLLRRRLRKRVHAAGTGVTRFVGNHPLIGGVVGMLVAVAMAGLTLLTLGMGRVDTLGYARQTSQNLGLSEREG